MANWNEDAIAAESDIPPEYHSWIGLEKSSETLDASDNIQQPSDMISQNSHECDPVQIQKIASISDFLMNDDYEDESNSFLASELPPKETPPDCHLSPNLLNGNSSPFPNMSTQTSFSNGHQDQTATEAFFHDDFCNKDDYSLTSILEPWKNNGGGEGGSGGNYANNCTTTTTFENTTTNLQINSSDQNVDQQILNNKSYHFVDSLSNFNGATEASTPQEMKEAFSKNPGKVMQIGGSSSYSSGNNTSYGWVPNGEGNYQRIFPAQPSDNLSLSYQNSSLVYSNSTNNASSHQYLGAGSTIEQRRSSLISYPNSSFGYNYNSTNYTSSPQYLGTRSFTGQPNASLSMPNSAFGYNNSNKYTSSPQYLGTRSITGQPSASLSMPYSSFGYNYNSTNYTSSPQYLGTRSITGQPNASSSMPNSSSGNQSNWRRPSAFHAGTSRDRSISEYSTRGSGQISRATSEVTLGDRNLSQIRNKTLSKDLQPEELNQIVASYARKDPSWWRKKDPATQEIFDKVFEKSIRDENEKRIRDEKANKKRKYSTREDLLASKKAASDPTPQGKTRNRKASKGLVIKERTQPDKDSGKGKVKTSTVDKKG